MAEPWREHSAEAQQALGARYATVCVVAAPHDDSCEHGYLLWADEPFTEQSVAREMTARGFTVTAVTTSRSDRQPWEVAISAGPDTRRSAYVVAFPGDYATAGWLGLWSPTGGRVVYHHPDEGLRSELARHALHSDKGQWEDPKDWVALVTADQAARIARHIGRPLPSETELNAVVHPERSKIERRWALWDEFTAKRLVRFAGKIRQVIEETDRLTALDPPRQQMFYDKDRRAEAERIAAAPVHVGESFPLVRFLIGRFRDRSRDSVGDHDALCNRLELTAPDGAEFTTLRGWNDGHFRWTTFRSDREGEILVPDDIDLMKGVRARFSLPTV